jgi:predicted RNA binding protein YcfA (HicA-like mRNA interferase family)
LEDFGFLVAKQKGSHIKIKKKTDFGFQVLTIPNHKEIDKGTLKAIFNQASKFISEEELRIKFYTK